MLRKAPCSCWGAGHLDSASWPSHENATLEVVAHDVAPGRLRRRSHSGPVPWTRTSRRRLPLALILQVPGLVSLS